MIMKITSIEKQKKNPNRYNIYLNGQYAFGVDEDLIVNYRLIVGKEVKEEDLPKLLFETEVGKLMERMYVLFQRRTRSEKEIRDYLRNLSFKRKVKGKEEISELAIESLIERLKSKDLLNDERFAKEWVESRRSSKKKGKIALKAELFQKGIDREVISEIIEETDNESESKLAVQALSKKITSWKNLPDLELKQKALQFLLRRGFDYDTALGAFEKIKKKDYNKSS